MNIKKKRRVKVAFLDRDGVLNSSQINNGYIGKVRDFKWLPGAKKTLKFLKSNDFKIIIVTNQSGVARAYFSLRDVYKINKYICEEMKKFGVKIDAIYFCPYHINGIVKKYKKISSLRKPNNGMFKLAQKKWNIDKKKSFMIGDQKTDMLFARKSKIKGYLFNEKNLYKFIKKII